MLKLTTFVLVFSSTSVLAGFINDKDDWDYLLTEPRQGTFLVALI